jgi:ubiquinone/menaquinone biosynthesis C-methylase UbiE
MSWYKDWFNSENYLKVYSHRDESEAERVVELIIKMLNLESGSTVLDMACGSGRHAVIFAKKGFDVTAVDLSQRLISEAKSNAVRFGANINFVLSDILDFNTPVRFDLALNLFTSIGYFENDEDNFSVIMKAYSLLKSNGYFVLDYFNKEYLLKNLVPETVFSENGTRIIQNRYIKNDRVIKDISIENPGAIEKYYESVRLYSDEEIFSYFEKAGFTIVEKFGDYNGSTFKKDSSSRLIIFAKK